MGRPFTDRERERLHTRLLEVASKHFARHGYRKAVVDDIARAAGIAKGSVYLFFRSKAELFAGVAMQAEAEIRQRLVEEAEKPARSAAGHLRTFFRLQHELLLSHPVLWIVADPAEAQAVFRDMPAGAAAELRESDDVFFADLVSGWRERDLIGRISPQVFAATLRALYVMELNRELIGPEQFEAVMALIIDALAKSLAAADRDVRKAARK